MWYYANAVNTVSENYKEEILTRFYGFSLEGSLNQEKMIYGILNGFDDELYNPKNNKNIYQGYDEKKTFSIGKKINRKALLSDLGLKTI